MSSKIIKKIFQSDKFVLPHIFMDNILLETVSNRLLILICEKFEDIYIICKNI